MASFHSIQTRLEALGQGHLLRFYPELAPAQQAALLRQLRTIQIDEINALFARAQDSLSRLQEALDDRLRPIPPEQASGEERCSGEVLQNYCNQGLQEIAQGKVAVVLMAGGQGTRLGVAHPKGMFSVGLPSGKTLFELQAHRIRALQRQAQISVGVPGEIPWYIMTSGPTNAATKEYLEAHAHFGLKPENVVIFEQGLLPCFDLEGKVLLETKHSVALAPDGNGGIYRALRDNGVLEDMARRGVEYVHVHSVDNILVKVADPVFIGYCVATRADCGAKVVRKDGPTEAVGVVCQVDGRVKVVEYSEITEETARKRDAEGSLVFNAGNICNHFFTVDFLKEVARKHEERLKLHVARKKVAHVGPGGELVRPERPEAIKIEKFVFDVFEFSERFVTWEVARWSEFSALKNGSGAGKDCPETARKDLLALHKRWLEEAGAVVETDEVEILPLVSYDGKMVGDLTLSSFVAKKIFKTPTIIDEEFINSFKNGH